MISPCFSFAGGATATTGIGLSNALEGIVVGSSTGWTGACGAAFVGATRVAVAWDSSLSVSSPSATCTWGVGGADTICGTAQVWGVGL